MRRFEDKVAIFTGAGTGIAEAITHKLAQDGAKVVANGLPDDPINKNVNKCYADSEKGNP